MDWSQEENRDGPPHPLYVTTPPRSSADLLHVKPYVQAHSGPAVHAKDVQVPNFRNDALKFFDRKECGVVSSWRSPKQAVIDWYIELYVHSQQCRCQDEEYGGLSFTHLTQPAHKPTRIARIVQDENRPVVTANRDLVAKMRPARMSASLTRSLLRKLYVAFVLAQPRHASGILTLGECEICSRSVRTPRRRRSSTSRHPVSS